MAKSNHIDQLVDSDTTVVFTFGYTGSGKTTLLVCLYEYLFRSTYIELNASGNREGANYLRRCAGDLRDDNKLPPITSLNTIKEVDWIFEMHKKKSVLTFLDMAGENLKIVSPREVDILTNAKSDGTLNPEITKYLETPNLPIILLCVVDYEKTSRDNDLIHTFIDILKGYNCNVLSAAVVVTKWDKNIDKDQDVLAYVKSNALATFNSLEKLVKEPYFFSFSVGSVNENNKEKVDNLDLSYCKSILDWLHFISLRHYESKDDEEETSKNILEYLNILFKYLKHLVPFFKTN